jgi:hypothetical protein
MDKFCLAIIGRCLSFQPWIDISDLYHRQLKSKLEKDDILLKVSIAPRSDLSPYERLKTLYEKKPLDGVLYHMPLIEPNQMLFYSKRDEWGKISYSLHPYFFKRFFAKEKIVYNISDAVHAAIKFRKKNDSHDLFEDPLPPVYYRKFLGVPLHKLNLKAGKLCGLNRWKAANELSCFEKFRTLCLDLKIPLFVLGPVPLVETFKKKDNYRVFQKTKKNYQRQLLSLKIPSYFLNTLHDERGNLLFKKDGQHLNTFGHTFLANELYATFSSWIKSIKKQNEKLIQL